MDLLTKTSDRSGDGTLEGQFLIAMPGMDSAFFHQSVIYMCAHSAEGAMGFVLNKPSDMTVADLIAKTELGHDTHVAPDGAHGDQAPVHIGGPVDEHRGFVLHSADYSADATMPISPSVSLTATIDVLRSIVSGGGPHRSLVALGYAGWGAGQLEQEIREHAWLIADADPALVFDHDDDGKYNTLIARLGIGAANFVPEGGRA